MDVNRGRSSPIFIVASLLVRLTSGRVRGGTTAIMRKRGLSLLVKDHPVRRSRALRRGRGRTMGTGMVGLLGRCCSVRRRSFLSTRLRVIPTKGTHSYKLSHDVILTCKRSSHIYTFASLFTVLSIGRMRRATYYVLMSGRRVKDINTAKVRSHFFRGAITRLLTLARKRSSLGIEETLVGSEVLSSSIDTTCSPVCTRMFRGHDSTFFKGKLMFGGFANTHKGDNSGSTGTRCLTGVEGTVSTRDITCRFTRLKGMSTNNNKAVTCVVTGCNVRIVSDNITILDVRTP